MLVGAGKKAARSMPAWTRISQAASMANEVAKGIVTSRDKTREDIIVQRLVREYT